MNKKYIVSVENERTGKILYRKEVDPLELTGTINKLYMKITKYFKETKRSGNFIEFENGIVLYWVDKIIAN